MSATGIGPAIAIGALAVMGLASGGISQAARSLTIQEINAVPFPSQLCTTHTNDSIAWVFNERGARNVWIYTPGATGDKARRLTSYTGDDGNDIVDLVWNGDGRSLFYTRGGAGGGRLPVNPLSLSGGAKAGEIWAVSAEGGAPRSVALGTKPTPSPRGDVLVFLRGGQPFSAPADGSSEPKQLFEDAGQVGEINWSPDGSRFAFVSSRPEHSVVGVYDFEKKSITWLSPSIDNDQGPVWSPDGSRVAILRTAKEPGSSWALSHPASYPFEIWIANAADGAGRRVFAAKAGRGSHFHALPSANHSLFWTADDRLVFPWEVTGWTRLYSLSIGHAGDPVLLTPGEADIFAAVLSDDRKRLVYSSNLNDIDRRHVWEISFSGEAPRQLTHSVGIEDFPVVTRTGALFAVRGEARTPLRPVRIEAHGMRDIAAEVVPKDYPAADLVEPQLVTFNAADGLKLHAQLFVPAGHAGKGPALLFFHGGPTRQAFASWDSFETHSHLYAANQYFANHGYIVLSVNYRGGLGYGLDFREPARFAAEGASEVNDIVGAAKFLSVRGDVDPKRIGVWGGSYGGLMTALALASAPEYFAAGADYAGVHDWTTIADFSGPDESARKLAYESSAISRVAAWRAPVLLLHGDNDPFVPIQQSIELAAALRSRGIPVENRMIPGETHFLLLDSSWNAITDAILQYMDQHLKR
jgi:dipeptidyl aminopeptidase/acylaminoacyl peptidase